MAGIQNTSTVNQDTASIFEQLLDFRWRGQSFPVTTFALDIRQDHAQHKWPDQDGAHVEATGRAPLIITARAVFRNGVAPGKAETFGVLYPTDYRTFLANCADRTTGDLQHPELGTIRCKVETFKTVWDANRRDGVDVDVTWVESNDNPDDLTKTLAVQSPIANTLLFASDLDTQMSQFTPPLTNPPNEPSFLNAIQTIQSAFDQTTLLSRQIGGQIDHVAYRVRALADSIATLRDVQTWPITQSIEHLKSSLLDLKKQLLVSAKTVSLYIVPADQTLAQICTTLGANITDLIKLNQSSLNSPTVPARTVIRYYGAS